MFSTRMTAPSVPHSVEKFVASHSWTYCVVSPESSFHRSNNVLRHVSGWESSVIPQWAISPGETRPWMAGSMSALFDCPAVVFLSAFHAHIISWTGNPEGNFLGTRRAQLSFPFLLKDLDNDFATQDTVYRGQRRSIPRNRKVGWNAGYLLTSMNSTPKILRNHSNSSWRFGHVNSYLTKWSFGFSDW